MCRLYGFRSNEETKIECSLVHAQNALLLQSRLDQTGRRHADGWGIAFYHDLEPDLVKRATAAFSDLHFTETAERVYAKAAVAHVRLATVGANAVVNSHPFVVGCWSFAHNGTVKGFHALEAQMLDETRPSLRGLRHGSTDSEQLFLWLLSRMEQAGLDLANVDLTAEVAGKVVAAAITELAHRCQEVDPDQTPRLNVVLTNGRILVATRWNNDLYLLRRDGVRDCEICGIPHVHHRPGFHYRAAVIASEPISHERWEMIPNQGVVLVEANLDVVAQPIADSAVA